MTNNPHVELIETWLEIANSPELQPQAKLKLITDSMKRWIKIEKGN